MRLPWDSEKRNRPQHMEGRQRSSDLYHTNRWTRLSRAFRAEHPLCECCRSQGRVKPAEVVDHIIPYPICGETGFYDRSNLQSLCQDCNIAKGNRDKKDIEAWKKQHSI